MSAVEPFSGAGTPFGDGDGAATAGYGANVEKSNGWIRGWGIFSHRLVHFSDY